MTAPDPLKLHPVEGQPRVVLLKPLVTSPLIEVGDYSYYDDPEFASDFESRNVLYHYGPEKLIIGKFCSIASNVRFIMNGANHRMSGPSTFPFPIMGGSWAGQMNLLTDLPNAGDTVVGHDVWIGRDVTVMPGTRIGSGSIVASCSVVSGEIAPYTIVRGNPAQPIRRRFDGDQIEGLLSLAWWDWAPEVITANVDKIMAGTVEELREIIS